MLSFFTHIIDANLCSFKHYPFCLMSFTNLDIETLLSKIGCDKSVGIYTSVMYDMYLYSPKKQPEYKLRDIPPVLVNIYKPKYKK